jgi:hypothetical protein
LNTFIKSIIGLALVLGIVNVNARTGQTFTLCNKSPNFIMVIDPLTIGSNLVTIKPGESHYYDMGSKCETAITECVTIITWTEKNNEEGLKKVEPAHYRIEYFPGIGVSFNFYGNGETDKGFGKKIN